MLNKFKITIISIVAIMMLAGCGVNEFEVLSTAGDEYLSTYVTPENAASPNISITDLIVLINGDDPPYIIDWRSAADYALGHIEGAVNMVTTDLDTKLDTLPTDQLIVNVCYSGQTASMMTSIINLIGQDEDYAGLEARNLLFGMCNFIAAPVDMVKTDNWSKQIASDEYTAQLETTTNTTTTVNDYPEIATGETTLAAIIKANLDTAVEGWNISAADVFTADADEYFILNYWPTAEYTDPGHIPGAFQFTPKTSLLSTSTLNLLPTDKTIVVYCYTGQTSAQVSGYLRLLGYDAKSLLYGFNGFAYDELAGHKYSDSTEDYSYLLGE